MKLLDITTFATAACACLDTRAPALRAVATSTRLKAEKGRYVKRNANGSGAAR